MNPPKPTRLKVLCGTDRPDRRSVNEPQPKRGRPVCPAWLSPEAKSKWKKLVPELDRLGLLTLIDGDCLASYCEAWAEFRRATETLATEGHYTQNAAGTKINHPAFQKQRTAWKAIREFAALYGLHPSGRAKLSVPPKTDDTDPFEELMREPAAGS